MRHLQEECFLDYMLVFRAGYLSEERSIRGVCDESRCDLAILLGVVRLRNYLWRL